MGRKPKQPEQLVKFQTQSKRTIQTRLDPFSKFLDHTIAIIPIGEISTKTYQKAMNLFLYIPPQSADLPGLIKSLVYGLLSAYYHQNSDSDDFIMITHLLLKFLLLRGNNISNLELIFNNAITTLEEKLNNPCITPCTTSPINGQYNIYPLPLPLKRHLI